MKSLLFFSINFLFNKYGFGNCKTIFPRSYLQKKKEVNIVQPLFTHFCITLNINKIGFIEKSSFFLPSTFECDFVYMWLAMVFRRWHNLDKHFSHHFAMEKFEADASIVVCQILLCKYLIVENIERGKYFDMFLRENKIMR